MTVLLTRPLSATLLALAAIALLAPHGYSLWQRWTKRGITGEA
jgi:TctA family transporter